MRHARWIGIVVVMLFLAGCATMSNTKSYSDMTPQEKLVYAQNIYNKVYDDTLTMGKNPNLTEAQLKVYRAKVDVISSAYQAIGAYKYIIDLGQTPTPEQEQELLDIINSLVTAGT